MIQNDLQKLGLSKNEAITYVAVQEAGKAKAGEIIKSTGLHRNLIYQALDSLSEKRLVTKSTTGKVSLFSSTDPAHLLDEIREKDLLAHQIIESLKKQRQIADQEITVYEGEEGMRAFNLQKAESLRPGEQILVLGAGGEKFERVMGERTLKKYYRRVEKVGGIRMLMYDTQRYSPELLTRFEENERYQVRLMPFSMTPSAGTVISRDSIAFLMYEDPVSVIEVKNPHLVEAYKAYFDVLWNQDVRVAHGKEALEASFYNMLEQLEPGEEYFVLGTNTGRNLREIGGFLDTFHVARIKKGVIGNFIAYQDAAPILEKRFRTHGDPELQLSRLKSLSTIPATPFQITLYRNTAVLTLYGDNPTVMHLEGERVYQGFKAYFDEIWNQRVRTYSGKDGYRLAFEDILRSLHEGDELLVSGIYEFDDEFAEFVVDFHKRRAKKGIKARIHLNVAAKRMREGLSPIALTDIKTMSSSISTPAVWLIYGDKTLLTVPGERVFMQVESAHASEAFRNRFEHLWSQTTESLEGHQGVIDLAELVLAEGKDLYLIGAGGKFLETHPEYYKEFTKRRKELRINIHALAQHWVRGTAFTKTPAVRMKYLPESFGNPMVVWVFGDYVAHVLWHETQRIFITHDKSTADYYRQYFKALEKTAVE